MPKVHKKNYKDKNNNTKNIKVKRKFKEILGFLRLGGSGFHSSY